MKRLPFLMVLLLCAGPTVLAASTTKTLDIHRGETLELDPYIIEYGQRSYGEQQEYLQIGRQEDSSIFVLKTLEGDAIYDAVGRQFNISTDLNVTINQLGRDDRGLFVELDVTATPGVFSSAEMTSSAPDRVIASQGSTVDIPLTIVNSGLTNQTFDLSANTSFEVTYGYQGFNVTEVYVGAGSSADVKASIAIPDTARLGEHTVTLRAVNRTRLSRTVTVEVRGAVKRPEMRMEIEQRFAAVNPGDTVRVPVSVMNTGEPPLRNVTFTVSAPDGWQYELRPTRFTGIEQYDRRRATLTVEAPADVSTGDFFVQISASSDQASSSTKRLRVNVSEKSRMGRIGLALMAVSLLLLIVVYLTFRRR